MKQRKRGRFPGDQWFQRKVENLMRKTLREQQAHGKMRGTTVEGLRGTAWYKEEFQKHAKLFKEIRKIQAEERAAHARSASLKEQAETAAMTERDKLWAAEHEGDSDEELLDYLRRCAAELGHTPMHRREVVGSTYISERFGNWAVALSMAGLPMPKKKRPRDTAVDAYLKRRQNAESKT